VYYFSVLTETQAIETLGASAWGAAHRAQWQAAMELQIDCPRIAWLTPTAGPGGSEVRASRVPIAGEFVAKRADEIAVVVNPNMRQLVRTVAHECRHVKQWHNGEFELLVKGGERCDQPCREFENDFAARFLAEEENAAIPGFDVLPDHPDHAVLGELLDECAQLKQKFAL